jgi:DNA-binding winged helix-turn-helix (wHTH) protein
MDSRGVFRFGAFTLDVGERRLSASGGPIRLSPKAFDVLAALVQHRGRLMKDELLARVWPESFVEEGIQNLHLAALRKALGDKGRSPSYIETVPRCGYRFVAGRWVESQAAVWRLRRPIAAAAERRGACERWPDVMLDRAKRQRTHGGSQLICNQGTL